MDRERADAAMGWKEAERLKEMQTQHDAVELVARRRGTRPSLASREVQGGCRALLSSVPGRVSVSSQPVAVRGRAFVPFPLSLLLYDLSYRSH